MNAKERYYWDLTGYLVLRDVFPPEDVKAANEAIDYLGEVVQSEDKSPEFELLRERSRPSIENGILTRTTNSYPFFLTLPAPHCEPFRKMIALPAIVSRPSISCAARGFRLDHGPQFIGGIKQHQRGAPCTARGEPHREAVAYHHQNGKAYVGGVTVTFSVGRIANRLRRLCMRAGIAQIEISHARRRADPRRRNGRGGRTGLAPGRRALFYGRRANPRHSSVDR